jgi:hypothetical protein
MADAETFKMLAVIESDAKGAIKDAEVLDAKYTSLGASFQKGQKRGEGAKEAQDKLNKSIQQGSKNTTEANVGLIKNLALMEAATSGLNQLVSAQYKRIDAQLAAGDITEEEAEKERKVWKEREKVTGGLETLIAVLRLATVAQAIYTAATNVTTASIKAQTIAVLTLNGALLANPIVQVVVGAAALAAMLLFLESRLQLVTKGVEAANEAFKQLIEFVEAAKDGILGLGEGTQEFIDNQLDKLGIIGDLTGGGDFLA